MKFHRNFLPNGGCSSTWIWNWNPNVHIGLSLSLFGTTDLADSDTFTESHFLPGTILNATPQVCILRKETERVFWATSHLESLLATFEMKNWQIGGSLGGHNSTRSKQDRPLSLNASVFLRCGQKENSRKIIGFSMIRFSPGVLGDQQIKHLGLWIAKLIPFCRRNLQQDLLNGPLNLSI